MSINLIRLKLCIHTKWNPNATTVAGGNGLVIYVADSWNDRVVRWMKGSTQGELLVGENGHGNQTNQFHDPLDLFFDEENNLYVVDNENHRVQKFSTI